MKVRLSLIKLTMFLFGEKLLKVAVPNLSPYPTSERQVLWYGASYVFIVSELSHR